MVDQDRVLRLLRALRDDIAVLRDEAGADRMRRADRLWLRGIKYTFVTAIEACVDVAQHFCASEGWGPPEDNRDAVRLLGTHRVLDLALADSMGKAVGFRNVLVHEYIAASDRIVLARLDDLADLERFASQIAAYLAVDSHRDGPATR